MLLSNYSVLNRNCYGMKANAFTNPMGRFKATLFNGFYAGEAVVTGQTDKSAFNNGYATVDKGGTAWWLSPKAGGLASRNLTGSGSLSISSLSLGKDLAAALQGSGTISSGTLALIVQLAASLNGSGSISAATLQAITNLSAALAGNGSVSAAALSLVVSLASDLEGTGGVSGNLKGTAGLSADIVVTGSGLTTSNVGSAVWNYILSCGYSADEAMQILTAVAAGKTNIVDNGGGSADVTFRDLADTKDVVTADMLDSERIAVVLDP